MYRSKDDFLKLLQGPAIDGLEKENLTEALLEIGVYEDTSDEVCDLEDEVRELNMEVDDLKKEVEDLKDDKKDLLNSIVDNLQDSIEALRKLR